MTAAPARDERDPGHLSGRRAATHCHQVLR